MTLKNWIATKLNISLWKDYPTPHFKDTNAMKWWVREKTVDYINSLTYYNGYVVILFHEFPTVSETIIESDRTITKEEVHGGMCGSLVFNRKTRFVVIVYNPKAAGEMCTDCLEDMIIHEVCHIEIHAHSNAFYAMYNKAVEEKNQKRDKGFFPISRDCKYCRSKTIQYINYILSFKGDENGDPGKESMPEMQPVHVTETDSGSTVPETVGMSVVRSQGIVSDPKTS